MKRKSVFTEKPGRIDKAEFYQAEEDRYKTDLTEILTQSGIHHVEIEDYRIIPPGALLDQIERCWKSLKNVDKKRLSDGFTDGALAFLNSGNVIRRYETIANVIDMGHVLSQRDFKFSGIMEKIEKGHGISEALLDDVVLARWETPDGRIETRVIDGQRRLVMIGTGFLAMHGIESWRDEILTSPTEIHVREVTVANQREAIRLFVLLQELRDKFTAQDLYINDEVDGEPVTTYSRNFINFHKLKCNKNRVQIGAKDLRDTLLRKFNPEKKLSHEELTFLSEDTNFSLIQDWQDVLLALDEVYPTQETINVLVPNPELREYYPASTNIPFEKQGFMIFLHLYNSYSPFFSSTDEHRKHLRGTLLKYMRDVYTVTHVNGESKKRGLTDTFRGDERNDVEKLGFMKFHHRFLAWLKKENRIGSCRSGNRHPDFMGKSFENDVIGVAKYHDISLLKGNLEDEDYVGIRDRRN